MNKDIFDNSFLRILFVILFSLTVMPFFATAQVASTQSILIIDGIICQGNENTECDFVTKKYYQQIGQVLDADEIADAKLRLGTLIQFKSVNIHLEKGSERNHVIVVFDVNEASNIQYELGASYNYTQVNISNNTCFLFDIDGESNSTKCDRNSTTQGPRLAAKITNFNFWGTGKELSLSINSDFYQNKYQQDYDEPIDQISMELKYSLKYIAQRHSVNLNYYDPYLFDSSDYYLSAGIGGQYSKISNRTSSGDGDLIVSGYSGNSSINVGNISLGRRFGRHSYVAIDLIRNLEWDRSYSRVSYGWNSEDDILFPTIGSAFTITNNLDFDFNSTDSSYKRHFSLANNKVLTLSGNASMGLLDGKRVSASLGLGVKYSSHYVIDKLNGSYSGWYIGTNLGGGAFESGRTDFESFFVGISAGYTHQTESMIYQLSLNLNLNESKWL